MAEIIVPPQKRRRPALSCVECRRRKVKCDRNLPCSHCLQLKNTVCKYSVGHPPVVNHRTAPKVLPTPFSVNNHFRSLEVPTLTPHVSETQSVEILSFPQTVPGSVDSSHSERGPWESAPRDTIDDSASEKNVQNLVSRAKSPEQSSLYSAPLNKESDRVIAAQGVNFVSFGNGLIHDGDCQNILRTRVCTECNSTPIQNLKGNLHKTQFFGRSHWMYTFSMIAQICRFKEMEGSADASEALELLDNCRRMSRAAKIERPIQEHIYPALKDYMPPREIADKLVDLYLRTCESSYRVLHIPYFKQEYSDYWKDPASASTPLSVRILLVMAIGTCFYQGEGADELRIKAQKWIHYAQSWTTTLLEKGQLNISGIQIYCLLLLARQINTVGVELIWYESGTLLRIAFSMGLHRDPKHFPKLTIFAAEIRRRIWATVLEMAVQTAVDTGMPPLITFSDFDTEPPSNIDDEDISESTTVLHSPRPNHVYTQTSIQIALLQSLRIRLEIVQLLNNFHSEPSYDMVLRFGQEITKACNGASRLTKSYAASLPRPSIFNTNLQDILVRRFIFEVHRPFFKRSQIDPRYYFSRKVCLEAALVILSYSGTKDLPLDLNSKTLDDYTLLKMVAGGFFKTIFFHATAIIIIELVLQLEEDITSGLPPSLQTKASREPLYQAINHMVKLVTERLRIGGNDGFAPAFFGAAAAHIDALTDGIHPEQAVLKTTKHIAQQCLEVLRARTELVPREPGIQSYLDTSVNERSDSIEEPDFGFDLLMQDANMDLGIPDGNMYSETPDRWPFSSWNAN